ncbi:Mor transcription activator family protein [Laribacter hongkongensis]|uniref:Mor transcription activator family protein n=1 Tax=Laribacter hongkongensis TaxID=168471 RepID=UPI001EFDBFEE|nr:Mor transcription activator family protein [Laribacter hongkongensis]MCG9040430.1 DNA transposition protein [Laribacter hongkongensis]MCG9067084.1 DNA transposition protein [Laribacter hongkongensis]
MTGLTGADLKGTGVPEMARLLVSLLGAETAAELINHLGGTTFPVSKNKTREGRIRHAMLAEVIGERDADLLCAHFGGEKIYIPACRELRQKRRDKLIRMEFDQLCSTYSGNEAVVVLCGRHRLCDRRIHEILKQPDTALVAA